jgi:hypothetical protein
MRSRRAFPRKGLDELELYKFDVKMVESDF